MEVGLEEARSRLGNVEGVEDKWGRVDSSRWRVVEGVEDKWGRVDSSRWRVVEGVEDEWGRVDSSQGVEDVVWSGGEESMIKCRGKEGGIDIWSNGGVDEIGMEEGSRIEDELMECV